jgi:hypothetical protein
MGQTWLKIHLWNQTLYLSVLPTILHLPPFKLHCFLSLHKHTWSQTIDCIIFVRMPCQLRCSGFYWNSGLIATFFFCQVAPETNPLISWDSFKYCAKYFAAALIETLVYMPFFLRPGGTWSQTHDHMIFIQILCQVFCSCSYLNSGLFAKFLPMLCGTWHQTLVLMTFIQVLFQICCSYWLASETNFPAIFILPVAPGFKPWILWPAIQCSINYVTFAALWISTYFWPQRFSTTILHFVARD